MSRIVVWYSDGAASAVAAKLTIAEHGHDNVVVATTATYSEHPDNARFRADIERWLQHPVAELRSTEYHDTWEVWERTGYLVGPDGARCTGELKKKPRFGFQLPNDVQVFGFTLEERARADRFRQQNIEVKLATPLIDHGLTKADCLGLLEAVGIALPEMYLLGYRNNNCIGCVKGGIGYWNKIRRDFPDVFARMAALEQRLGRTVLREETGEVDAAGHRVTRPLPLIALDPSRGRHADEPDIECSVLCAIAVEAVA
ncbi:hypothetical protein E1258_27675 [Micromonospora sp. KC207]|uniref:hypothetical protein n=1 Tax=Micromonospora sp. KC207 TaxID=2530377 RepID=UPI0010466C75|nr:hypothetical protein [Micromonospora sp. KC207]TDC48856.1 hypothetical protein E1258_27675 [Micromonospora sp. KC207]